MSRLTERIGECVQCNDRDCRLSYCDRYCGQYQLMIEKLADYEDKQEQGLLIELPIAIGSDVYYIPSKVNYDLNVMHNREEFNRVYHQKIARLHFTESVWFGEGDLNLQYGLVDRIFVSRSYKETWFTTRFEAEEALARMKGE